MNKKFCLLIAVIILGFQAIAQNSIVSGPMLGPIELRDAKIWLEVKPAVKTVALQYWKKGDSKKSTINYRGQLGNDFNPVKFTIGGLDFNTTYEYQFIIDGKPSNAKGDFKTKDLWQYRKPAPDFSFLTGSCAYFNDPKFDRPGRSYGRDSSIFEVMAREPASFMVWLGDNWYTREVDYYSEWGLWNRASRDRSLAVLQNFWKAMPHYATWDDHDFGPNNSGREYALKEVSRKVFMNYWANHSFGENGQGIYTSFTWGDVEIFFCDDRWWRSSERLHDSVNSKPNPDKRMFGEQQMEWLKNALSASNAVFKIVVSGSQILNSLSIFDKLGNFPIEYKELMDFLSANRVYGVVFLSGDRHHSEVIKMDRPGKYPLYDITVSPLTATGGNWHSAEANNPFRVFGLTEKQNYGKISFSGPRGDRKMTVEYRGLKGEKLGEWSVGEKELRWGQ